ncbi:hypothetical protein B0H10DRAFT_470193 [Mycena sp. CBHHK59/15]|nr:hypothetical protein B0H10DRAFT_470193 [Mycena sp. CBHHK59/15]
MKHWADLSKGEWSEEEQQKRCKFLLGLMLIFSSDKECNNFCRCLLPCFFQVDILVRSLLSDPAVGYVPPFVIFHSFIPEGKTCVLFTKPLHRPRGPLVRDMPGSCTNSTCPHRDCAAIDMDASLSLAENSHMVRKWDNVLPKRIVCNLWGYEVQHSEDSEVELQRCQKMSRGTLLVESSSGENLTVPFNHHVNWLTGMRLASAQERLRETNVNLLVCHRRQQLANINKPFGCSTFTLLDAHGRLGSAQ